MRRVASERDSGLEKAERSRSSGQGRRREKAWRRERRRWLAKEERGIWGWGWDWGLEMGRMAGEEDCIIVMGEKWEGKKEFGGL